MDGYNFPSRKFAPAVLIQPIIMLLSTVAAAAKSAVTHFHLCHTLNADRAWYDVYLYRVSHQMPSDRGIFSNRLHTNLPTMHHSVLSEAPGSTHQLPPPTTTSKIWRKEGHTLNVFYQIENWIKRYSEPLNIEN